MPPDVVSLASAAPVVAAPVDDSAVAVAAAIARGERTSLEVVRSLLARIDRLNPRLNALVTIDRAAVEDRARAADRWRREGRPLGVLHGVPVTIKDSFDTAGLRTTAGHPPFCDRVPAHDAAAVARLVGAGAIVLGKTNLPPLANGIQTSNPIFGRTVNPWDPARTPGGSSGGGAAAVAAGLSLLELGSDISGSLRIPAHFCGVYALKPTTGRVPVAGHVASARPLRVPAPWRGLLELAAAGPIARHVEDLRLALVALTGARAAPAPVAQRPLRLLWTKSLGGAPLDRPSRRALDWAAQRLAAAGFAIDERPPALDLERAWYTAGVCLGAINTLMQAPPHRWLRALGARVVGRLGHHPLLHGLCAGARLRDADISRALQDREAIRAQVEVLLGGADAWICPVFPTAAFTHRGPHASLDVDGTSVPMLVANLAHEVLFNVTGHPVVALPLGLDEQDLPVGVQVVGAHGQDFALLDVAAQLDAVIDGHRMPGERAGVGIAPGGET